MLQVANEDAIADLVCCGEVYEVEIPVTIPDNFEVQVLDSLVNFFLGDVHGRFFWFVFGVVPPIWDHITKPAWVIKNYFSPVVS